MSGSERRTAVFSGGPEGPPRATARPTRLGRLSRRMLCGFVLALGAWSAVSPSVVSAQEASEPAGEAQQCTRRAGGDRPGQAIEPAVKLAPDVAGHVVNFGGSREWQFVDVVLNADPALPRSLEPGEIRLEVVRRFTRASENLKTTWMRRPTFTQPRISPGRARVTFTMCLNGAGLEAGSYSGSVLIEGPRGLAPASISITANAKDSTLALWGGVAVLALAALFLVLRGAAARQARTEEKQAKSGDAKSEPQQLTKYVGGVLKDLNWWITSIVALGLAAGTIIGIYSANPAWGADTLGSVASLVGPAFTAVGVQSVITSLGRGVDR